jgi:hypothetical protein
MPDEDEWGSSAASMFEAERRARTRDIARSQACESIVDDVGGTEVVQIGDAFCRSNFDDNLSFLF